MSDLRQTRAAAPATPTTGDDVALRFGPCCPRLDAGRVVGVADGSAILRVGLDEWRLARCAGGSGIHVPGIVSENWFVVERLAR